MDVVQQYSSEALFTMLKKMSEREKQVLDIVQLLLLGADDNENNQQVMLQELKHIRQVTTEINSKVDVVLETLTRLETEIVELKRENRNPEEKLKLMSIKMSKIEESVQSEDLDEYYELAQSLYENWGELDELTQRFIPIAEFLYSKLQKFDKPDYSPVILELCRAIENEFLLKIFKRYTMENH